MITATKGLKVPQLIMTGIGDILIGTPPLATAARKLARVDAKACKHQVRSEEKLVPVSTITFLDVREVLEVPMSIMSFLFDYFLELFITYLITPAILRS